MDRRLRPPSPRSTPARLGRAAAFVAVLLAPLALPVAAQQAPPAPPQPPGVILQGLDKVTARISTIEVPLNTVVRFGTLEIAVRACYKTPPTEPPESTAFLEIFEARPGEPRESVFSGWMFASSPALSALEHAVYDVWVIDCTNVANSASLNPG